MSFVADREALAGALAGTTGITSASAYAPSAPRAGSAWVVLTGVPKDATGPGFTAEWSVIIAVPTNPREADVFVDNGLSSWLAALRREMTITGATPVTVQIGQGNTTMPAFSIAGRRELS